MSRCFLNAYVFFLAVLILVLVHDTSSQLNPGGNNVCRRTVYYNAYESRSDRRIGYDIYRTCCKRLWNICTSRCTRTRSKWITYYKSVLVTKTKYAYECCAGWAKTNRDCSAPICSSGCINGKCISPNKCQCASGYQGKNCQSDLCKDTDARCYMWARTGKCSTDATMKTKCCTSCTNLQVNCKDEHANCMLWKDYYCNTEKSFMHVICRKSCNICQ